jgi:hypothetical protein
MLRFKLDAAGHAALDAGTRSHYRQDGDAFVLDTDGVSSDDIKGLKSGLDKERAAARAAAKLQEAFGEIDPKDVPDLAEINRLIASQPDAVAARARLREVFPDEIARTKAELRDLQAKIAKGEQARALTDAVVAAKGHPPLVEAYINANAKIDAKGVVKTNEGETFATIAEYLLHLTKIIPGGFAGSGGAGGVDLRARPASGIPGTLGRGAAPGGGAPKAPTSRSKMTIAEKANYTRLHGTEGLMKIPP